MYKVHMCDTSLHVQMGKHIKLNTFIFKHSNWNFKNCNYTRNFRNGKVRRER